METNQLLINYYKKEEIKKAKQRRQEGSTLEEIIRLSNKEYISVEEIKQALGIDEDDYDIEKKEEIEPEEHKIDEHDTIIEDEENNNEQTVESNNDNVKVVMIAENKLEDYPNQPFKLYDDDKKQEMIESIKINGIMQPLIVRPIGEGKYQILAGHNRRICAKEVGLTELPCIIKENLTDDEAKIYLIDTNLCTRDNISPMERAKAYRMKYDTYKKRNIKTLMIEEIKKDNYGMARAAMMKEEKTSNGTIQRYLRLTYLIPELQEAIDNDKIKINTGEKLSFLPKQEQNSIAELLEENIKISDSIAKKIKQKSEKCREEDIYHYLSKEEIKDIINKKDEFIEESIKVTFYKNEIEEYFENRKTESQIKKYIFEILEKVKIS